MKSGIALILGLLLVIVPGASAQDVIEYNGSATSLDDKWEWAENELDRNASDTWIGYSIERMMRENHHIGSYSSRRTRSTFGELLYGVKPQKSHRQRNESDREVLKEVVFLFQNDGSRISDLKFSTLDGEVYLDGDIIWLGAAEASESLDKVEALMGQTRSNDVREDFTAAIAMHDSKRALAMLTEILDSDASSDVRGQATFWMSQMTESDRILDKLVDTAKHDRSDDVQEKAVFAVSQVDGEKATDALIELAQSGPREIRDEAVFWLGQEASDKAVASLSEIIEDDPDIEIKKQALFALSQQDSAEGLNRLIRIAKTNESPALRKEAIFWLSQSDSQDALDAIVDIVKG